MHSAHGAGNDGAHGPLVLRAPAVSAGASFEPFRRSGPDWPVATMKRVLAISMSTGTVTG